MKISQVAAVATMAGEVIVELSEAVRARVKASSEWVTESMRKGIDTSQMTVGLGATSHRRTKQGGNHIKSFRLGNSYRDSYTKTISQTFGVGYVNSFYPLNLFNDHLLF